MKIITELLIMIFTEIFLDTINTNKKYNYIILNN